MNPDSLAVQSMLSAQCWAATGLVKPCAGYAGGGRVCLRESVNSMKLFNRVKEIVRKEMRDFEKNQEKGEDPDYED